MTKLIIVCLLLVLIDRHEAIDGLFPIPFFRLFRDVQLQLTGRTTNDPRLLKAAKDNNKIQKQLPVSYKFPCFNDDYTPKDARSKERPTSVHRLRLGDIDVIGAMGDSLTAGNGAAGTNIFHIVTENRGISWSAGGQGTWREYFTVPNMLKVFNPKLIGYALGDGLPHHRISQFNVAEIGAISQDYPYMATQLVKRMRNDRRVDMEKDWKMITMMIGDNDFCISFCYEDKSKIIAKHRRELYSTLMYLKKNLKRTIINLVPPPDASLLASFKQVPFTCSISHILECPCLFGEPNKSRFKGFQKLIKQWQRADAQVGAMAEFNDREDFAVVVQPFTMEVNVPVDSKGITDYSYLSTDCFHFSQKGYARAASGLWNNLVEPVGNKTIGWQDPYINIKCPTSKHPYIYTAQNSVEENVV